MLVYYRKGVDIQSRFKNSKTYVCNGYDLHNNIILSLYEILLTLGSFVLYVIYGLIIIINYYQFEDP